MVFQKLRSFAVVVCILACFGSCRSQSSSGSADGGAHLFGVAAASARFKINASASTNGGIDLTAGAGFTLQLESTTGVLKVKFSIYDGTSGSPLASRGAPAITLSNSGVPTTYGGTVSGTLPGSGVHSYMVRCVVNDGVDSNSRVTAAYTFERIIAIRSTAGIRKIIATEGTQYGPGGWADAQNDQTDAITITGAALALSDHASFRVLSSGGLTDGQTISFTTPPGNYVWSASTGAGFSDDDNTILKLTATAGGSNGRAYSTAPAPVVATVAALRLAVSGKNNSISVQAYSALGDRGGDIFDYDSADTTTADNNCTTFVAGTRRYKRRFAGTVIPATWCGAIPNDQTKDAVNGVAINAAITLANSLGGGTVQLPTIGTAGEYFVDRKISIGAGYTGVSIVGSGMGYTDSPRANKGSALRVSTNFPLGETVLELTSARRCAVENLVLDGMDTGSVYRAGILLDDTGTVAAGLNISNRFSRLTFRSTRVQAPTFTASGATITLGAHKFRNGMRVYLSTTNTLPSGLSAGTIESPHDGGLRYWIVGATSTTVGLSLTEGGSAIVTGSAGTGTHTLRGLGYAVHVGGFVNGVQVSNTLFDTLQFTDTQIGRVLDGSSGTTDIIFMNVGMNNAVDDGVGTLLDAGELRDIHVNYETGGAARAGVIINPPFGAFSEEGSRHECFDGVPAWVGVGTAARSSSTELTGTRVNFTNVLDFTVNAGTNVLHGSAPHYLRAGERLDVINTGGGLPAGLSAGVRYYVLAAGLTATDMKVSLTDGGAEIDETTAGTGVQWMRRRENVMKWEGDGPLHMRVRFLLDNPGLDSGFVDLNGHAGGGESEITDSSSYLNGAGTRNTESGYVVYRAHGTYGNAANLGSLDSIRGGLLGFTQSNNDPAGVTDPVYPPGMAMIYYRQVGGTTDGLQIVDGTAGHARIASFINGGTLDVLSKYTLGGAGLVGHEIAGITGGVAHIGSSDNGGFAQLGGSPAAAGPLRFGKVALNGIPIASINNNAGSADLRLLSADTSDNIYLGWTTAVLGTYIYGTTVNFGPGGSGTVAAYVKTTGLRAVAGDMGWDTAAINPTLMMDDKTTNSGTGTGIVIRGQNETGTTSVGGLIDVKGGTGTSTGGAVTLRKADGTARLTVNDTGVGFYTATPVAQPVRPGQITDNTTGSVSSDCADVGVVFSQAAINNCLATLLDRVNKLETIDHNNGLCQ